MRTYIITGMGRSGTSFLSQALIDQGVNMGDKMYYDQKENVDLVDINKDIYSELAEGWSIAGNPPKLEDVRNLKEIQHLTGYDDRIESFVENNKCEKWGFKEPRFTFTHPLILPKVFEVDDDPFIYIALRKPKYIAKSLQKLTGCSYDKGVEVAKKYHEASKQLIDFISKYE